MNRKSQFYLPLGALFALGVGFSGSASADFMDCDGTIGGESYDISGKVSPSSDCTILEPIGGNTNDFVGANDSSQWTVNKEAFFGFDDWLFDGKWEAPDRSTDEDGNPVYVDKDENLLGDSSLYNDGSELIEVNGNAQSGSWTLVFPDFWNENSELMFVLKDGNNTNLVGYLIESLFMEGLYASPFTDPPFPTGNANARDISHISIYYRAGADNGTGPIEIPAPGVLGLFGIGLLGLGWVATRRRWDG